MNLKMVPTCEKLLPIIKKKRDFNWSEWTLRHILRDRISMKKCVSKRRILSEIPDIVSWKCNYLQKM
jgi:hypothetical protein